MKNVSMRSWALLVVSATSALAAADLNPTSYDMLNGNGQASGGSFNYWDLNYSGSGSTNVDNDPLSGGLGDLTDGVIATQNWYMVENSAGTGPYVGWRGQDPTVTFHFASVSAINSITVYADDSGGVGGVSLPKSITVNGNTYPVGPNPNPYDPMAINLTGLGLLTDTVNVTFNRGNEWVFVSEVKFNGAAVPEPATMAVLGLGMVGLIRRKRK